MTSHEQSFFFISRDDDDNQTSANKKFLLFVFVFEDMNDGREAPETNDDRLASAHALWTRKYIADNDLSVTLSEQEIIHVAEESEQKLKKMFKQYIHHNNTVVKTSELTCCYPINDVIEHMEFEKSFVLLSSAQSDVEKEAIRKSNRRMILKMLDESNHFVAKLGRHKFVLVLCLANAMLEDESIVLPRGGVCFYDSLVNCAVWFKNGSPDKNTNSDSYTLVYSIGNLYHRYKSVLDKEIALTLACRNAHSSADPSILSNSMSFLELLLGGAFAASLAMNLYFVMTK